MSVDFPVRKTMCGTCPFKPGSKYEDLRPALERSALTESTRICHSTGSNAINEHTGLPEYGCRGARDVQLRFFYNVGVIKEPTDESWNAKREEIRRRS
jgi:hypothetical protein